MIRECAQSSIFTYSEIAGVSTVDMGGFVKKKNLERSLYWLMFSGKHIFSYFCHSTPETFLFFHMPLPIEHGNQHLSIAPFQFLSIRLAVSQCRCKLHANVIHVSNTSKHFLYPMPIPPLFGLNQVHSIQYTPSTFVHSLSPV